MGVKSFYMRWIKVFLVTVLFWPVFVSATDYQEREDVKAFAKAFAKKHNQSETAVLKILAKAQKQQAILDAISAPAERVLTWERYRKIFIEKKRVLDGVAFWQEHKNVFDAVAQKYQVPPEIIVAIMGVETRYGRITGSYKVLDALVTLGFDYPPRAVFFKGQLEQLLLLGEEQQLAVETLLGSYAGAMGYGQFIPGSYRAYAVDYDGDGKVDIWQNSGDAIASVANYFAKHHWRPGDLVAVKLASQMIDEKLLSKGLQPDTTVGQLRKQGVHIAAAISDDAKVTLMKHEGAAGVEYWLGFHNFYVITRYNHSAMYALAAFQLSQLLKGHLHGW